MLYTRQSCPQQDKFGSKENIQEAKKSTVHVRNCNIAIMLMDPSKGSFFQTESDLGRKSRRTRTLSQNYSATTQ